MLTLSTEFLDRVIHSKMLKLLSQLVDAMGAVEEWRAALQFRKRFVCVTLTMHTMGSSSLSLGTSIQVISMAAGSPGEQGVKRSSTITWLLLRDGPRTCTSFKKKKKEKKKQSNAKSYKSYFKMMSNKQSSAHRIWWFKSFFVLRL